MRERERRKRHRRADDRQWRQRCDPPASDPGIRTPPLQDEVEGHARHYEKAYPIRHLQRPEAAAAAARSGSAVDRIDPANLFRPLDRLDVKIDDDRLMSLRTNTHSSVSSVDALISWCGT